jgi:DNA-binding transcriptional MerR regulator
MTGMEGHDTRWPTWQAEDARDPGELLTRAEVLATAKALNIRHPDGRPINERTLRYWEDLEIIPRGTPATKGYRYNLYPWWVVDMLYQVLRYQERGLELDHLHGRMRAEAVRLSQELWPRPKEWTRRQGRPDFSQIAFGDYITWSLNERPREPSQPPFPAPADVAFANITDQLVALLNAIAPGSRWAPARQVATRVRLEYLAEDGETIQAYDVPLDDPEAAGALAEAAEEFIWREIRKGWDSNS